MKKPQAYIRKTATGKMVSFRWYLINFDAIKKEDFFFIQYGSNPIKFICKLKRGCRPPTFLFSSSFKTLWAFKTFRFGSTTKPLDVAKFWRTLCRDNTLAHYRNGNMKNPATNSGTIVTIAARE